MMPKTKFIDYLQCTSHFPKHSVSISYFVSLMKYRLLLYTLYKEGS